MAKTATQKKVKEEPMSKVETPETAEAQAQELEQIQLTISDLQQLSRIVDLASRRGAFQANELSQIGAAYNKVTTFLAYVQAMQEKEEKEKAAQEQE